MAEQDRQKWNAWYSKSDWEPTFEKALLLARALDLDLPPGDVLELACGLSGNALKLASAGRDVVCLDVSDVALDRLNDEARSRGVADRITCHHADLDSWQPDPDHTFSLVMSVMFWDATVFKNACQAVRPGGLLAWEAFSEGQLRYRPSMRAEFRLESGQPASLLTGDFEVLHEEDLDDGSRATRRLIARKVP